jgi:anaerobic selenocysteine-containing dehydrogenase
MLRGNLGRRARACAPCAGHSNVQGDRTMGVWPKPAASFLDALDAEFGITSPRAHGFDTVDALRAMHDGRVKVLFAMGGNFAVATPDTGLAARPSRAASSRCTCRPSSTARIW